MLRYTPFETYLRTKHHSRGCTLLPVFTFSFFLFSFSLMICQYFTPMLSDPPPPCRQEERILFIVLLRKPHPEVSPDWGQGRSVSDRHPEQTAQEYDFLGHDLVFSQSIDQWIHSLRHGSNHCGRCVEKLPTRPSARRPRIHAVPPGCAERCFSDPVSKVHNQSHVFSFWKMRIDYFYYYFNTSRLRLVPQNEAPGDADDLSHWEAIRGIPSEPSPLSGMQAQFQHLRSFHGSQFSEPLFPLLSWTAVPLHRELNSQEMCPCVDVS